jgi:DNA-binding transcriptional LysR family regulator
MHLRELDANLIVVLDALLIDASVTRAAERLGRSPSAVSHALANLREVFHDELFVRAGQRLTPTAKALQLAPAVHVIVSGIESLLRPAAPFDPASQRRTFTLACRDSVELTLLRALRDVLRREAPGVAVLWRALDSRQYLDELRCGQTQFAMIEGEAPDASDDFGWSHLYDETHVTLARREHPLARQKPSREAFFDWPLILATQPHNRADPIRDAFTRISKGSARLTDASSVFTGLFMAVDSDALITAPLSIAGLACKTLPLAPVEQPFPPLVVGNYLAWHRSQERDECHEWARDRIKTLAVAQT